MFKVIFSEIKKMLAKPGIYVLAGFLALILVLGVFVYNPKPVEDKTLTLSGDTYIQKYTEFTKENGTKALYDERLAKTTAYINYYTVQVGDETISRGKYIGLLFEDYQKAYQDYFDSYYKDAMTIATAQELKENLSEKLIALNAEIQTAISNSANGCYAIITTSANYKQYLEAYNEVLSWSKSTITQKENIKADCKNYKDNYESNFVSAYNEFIFPTLSEKTIKKYTDATDEKTKLYQLNLRLSAINETIEENKEICQSDATKNNENASLIDDLANQYVNTINTYINLVNYEMIVNAFSVADNSIHSKLMYLSTVSSYNSKSLLARYTYIFDNNKVEEEFARPLTIGVTSNNDTNAFDYSYFVLKLFSFVIIFYAIMAVSRAIAGEQKEGTLRYLATRPVTRNQIFFGKLLAVLIMSAILIIFSSVVALCVGGGVYGFKSLNILTIFNGTTPIVITPLGMLAVYALSMFLEILVYTSIAYLISILINSDLIGVTLTVVLTVINLLLPVFINGFNTWLAFYPFSYISLFSLFGSSVFAPSNDFFNMLLGAKVYSATSIILVLCVILVVTIVSWIISLIKFKRKEL